VLQLAGRLAALDPWVWAYAFVLALGLGFAVYGVTQQRGGAGLMAMLLASLAAGTGVVRQLRTERAIEVELTAASLSGVASPVELAEERTEVLRSKHGLARVRAAAALMLLLFGAIAALRYPAGSRAVAVGFLGVGLLSVFAALIISSRPADSAAAKAFLRSADAGQ
jgi:hypothetical protein